MANTKDGAAGGGGPGIGGEAEQQIADRMMEALRPTPTPTPSPTPPGANSSNASFFQKLRAFFHIR